MRSRKGSHQGKAVTPLSLTARATVRSTSANTPHKSSLGAGSDNTAPKKLSKYVGSHTDLAAMSPQTTSGKVAINDLLTGGRPAAPVVHIRIRPLLPHFGESSDQRKVWFLDSENIVVLASHTQERRGTFGSMSNLSSLLSVGDVGARGANAAPVAAAMPTLPPLDLSPSSESLGIASVECKSRVGSDRCGSGNHVSTVSSPISGTSFPLHQQATVPNDVTAPSTKTTRSGDSRSRPLVASSKGSIGADATTTTKAASPSSQCATQGRLTSCRSLTRAPRLVGQLPGASAGKPRSATSRVKYPTGGMPFPPRVNGASGVDGDGGATAGTETGGVGSAGYEQHFRFEFVHDESASQEEVFEESVLRFADEALLAQNVAILCYGPTGSGKTYSMMGADCDVSSATHRRRKDRMNRRSVMPSAAVSHSVGSSQSLRSDSPPVSPHRPSLDVEGKGDVPEERGSRLERGNRWPSPSGDAKHTEAGAFRSTDRACLPKKHNLFSWDLADMEQGTAEMGILPRLVRVLLDRCGEAVSFVKEGDPSSTLRANKNQGGVVRPQDKTPCYRLSLTLRELTFYGIEIHVDELSDLLDPGKRPINNVGDIGGLEALCQRLNQASAKGNHTSGGRSSGRGGGMPIKSIEDLRRAYRLARRNRVTASHQVNDTSSRSHAIFILQLEFDLCSTHISNDDECMSPRVQRVRSYVAMVDLAGCERIKESKVRGAALRETQYINKSLSALSSVVLALYQNSSHIPYRDSKLTRLLRPCLEGGRVLTLVHVSPCSSTATINSLKFADQIRHTRVQTHSFGDSKPELLGIFEDLVDAAQGQLQAGLRHLEHQYAQLCAETRLSYLDRLSIDGDAGEHDAQTTHAVTNTPVEMTGSPHSPEVRSSVLTVDSTPAARRSFAIRRLAHRHFSRFFASEGEDVESRMMAIERERDRRVEAARRKREQDVNSLQASIEELNRYNARLAEENTTPLPRDPYSQEVAKQLKETTEELNEYVKNRCTVTSFLTVLRQRLGVQDELEAAVCAELLDATQGGGSTARTGIVTGHLNTATDSFTASSGDIAIDAETREVGHQQMLLAGEMSRLRMEVACFEMGDRIWEGLWARAMREELMIAMHMEVTLMEEILLYPPALQSMLQNVSSATVMIRDGDGTRSGITASQAITENSQEARAVVPLRRGSLIETVPAEEEVRMRLKIRQYLSESQRDGVRPPLLPLGACTLPPIITTFNSSVVPMGQTLATVVPCTLTLPSAPDHPSVVVPPSLGEFVLPSDQTCSASLWSGNASLASVDDKRVSKLPCSPPRSLVGCYDSEEALQRVSILKLLEEGIPCEVCCIGSSFEHVLNEYLCPREHDIHPLSDVEDDENSDNTNCDGPQNATHSGGTGGTSPRSKPLSPLHGRPAALRTSHTVGLRKKSVPTPHDTARAGLHAASQFNPPCSSSRWGRLCFRRSPEHPEAYCLEFVYVNHGLPLSRRMAAAMQQFHSEEKPEGIEMMKTLPVPLAARPAEEDNPFPFSDALPFIGFSRDTAAKERRFFSIPLCEPQLSLNVHLLEAGTTSASLHVNTQGMLLPRHEANAQVAIEISGIPPATEGAHSPTCKSSLLHTMLRRPATRSTLTSSGGGMGGEGGSLGDAQQRPPAATRDVVMAKRMEGDSELLLPTASILGGEGTCTIVCSFPESVTCTSTRLEGCETILAALAGVLPPTYFATPPSRSSDTRCPSPSPHARIGAPHEVTIRGRPSVVAAYYHVPYALLFPAQTSDEGDQQARSLSVATAAASPSHPESSPPPCVSCSSSEGRGLRSRNTLRSLAPSGDRPIPVPAERAALQIHLHFPGSLQTSMDFRDTDPSTHSTRRPSALPAQNPDVGGNICIVTGEEGAPYVETDGFTTGARDTCVDSVLNMTGMESGPVKESPAFVEASIAQYIGLAAMTLQQLCAVTIGPYEERRRANTELSASTDPISPDVALDSSVYIGLRLQQLLSFRRSIRSLVKQQIYDAEDIKAELAYCSPERVLLRGSHLKDIQLEAKMAIGLRLPPVGGSLLSKNAVDILTPLSECREVGVSFRHDNDGYRGVRCIRSDVSVALGRELCGFSVPWTIWQWAYRWSAVAEAYQAQETCYRAGESAGELHLDVSYGQSPPRPAAKSSSPWRSGCSPLLDGSSTSSDELYYTLSHGNWMQELLSESLSAPPKTVWLPELHFAPVPGFLGNVAQ